MEEGEGEVVGRGKSSRIFWFRIIEIIKWCSITSFQNELRTQIQKQIQLAHEASVVFATL